MMRSEGEGQNNANESGDKKKEEKIILNYLCCLVYDACGIRWDSFVFKIHLQSIELKHCQCM